MKTFLVATTKSWNRENFLKLQSEDDSHRWVFIDAKEDLTIEKISEYNPRYIFFPHWSWIIPEIVFTRFECVVFHMADLPYGRGGSPLQNLIVRGHTDTVLSALRVVKDLDAGDIYMKRPLSLEGTAEDILRRASDLTFEMIRAMVATEPAPVPQEGEIVEFTRRKPKDGNIEALEDIKQIYNHIRMLDAEGYPHAFIETKTWRCEFSDAELTPDGVQAKAVIVLKKKSYE